jgi:arylsulfatase A-like enzyme
MTRLLFVFELLLLLSATETVFSAERIHNSCNVVLIFADDLGYGQLSCYGGKETLTPHIDSIAEEGVRFTDGYVTAATCSPSRAGLMSGRYQQRFGFEFNTLGQRACRAMTAALDDGVGRILSSLREQGIEDQTLVIFLSDNGAAKFHGVGDNGPYRLGKLFLFEGGVRVPFLMKWPGRIQPGTVNTRLVSALDLFPTICTAAEAKPPVELVLDGVDLLPWLDDAKPGTPREHLFWRNGPNRAVRKGDWKLVQAGNHVWLFDLKSDPGEKQNLAEQHPDVVMEMQKVFEIWQREMREPAWPSKFESQPNQKVIDGVEYEIHV